MVMALPSSARYVEPVSDMSSTALKTSTISAAETQRSLVSLASLLDSICSSAAKSLTPASCSNSWDRPTASMTSLTFLGMLNTALFMPMKPTPLLNLWSSKRFVDLSSMATAISRVVPSLFAKPL